MTKEAIREKSDPRTTEAKISELGWALGELGLILDDKVKHDYEGVEEYLLLSFTLLQDIEEEVKIMVKCQLEMRKTIKEKTYTTVIDARRDQSGGLRDEKKEK